MLLRMNKIAIELECECGKVKGFTHTDARSRFVCLCNDCQAYAVELGTAARTLDKNGGTEILPVYPADTKIVTGREQLRCLRLSDKGMYRWYADCCKTPIANVPEARGMP